MKEKPSPGKLSISTLGVGGNFPSFLLGIYKKIFHPFSRSRFLKPRYIERHFSTSKESGGWGRSHEVNNKPSSRMARIFGGVLGSVAQLSLECETQDILLDSLHDIDDFLVGGTLSRVVDHILLRGEADPHNESETTSGW